jgi:hypothetical protein
MTEASVREFVKNNMHEYSFRRVNEPWLKSLLGAQRATRRRAELEVGKVSASIGFFEIPAF